MGRIQKISFPYLLGSTAGGHEKIAIFFGTDFYNLPIGSDQKLFTLRTNGMLAYVRRHFPDVRLLYQPHPNETDEYTLLDLSGFEVGKRTIADIFLAEQAPRIAGVFAACSWAAASAYSMGFRAGVFLDSLKDAIPDDALIGYRSYFAGFPDSFFINSFDQELPPLPPRREDEERRALESIEKAIGNAKTVWFLSSDPAYVVHAAMLAQHFKHKRLVSVNLISARTVRWRIVDGSPLYAAFDKIVSVQSQKYTARPQNIPAILRDALELSRLPIRPNDAVISFAHPQFAENCILSWYPHIKKILMLESRWYHVNYEEEWKALPEAGFRTLPGVRFFNRVVEPLLRLHRTVYKEYADGKGTNIYRYAKPLESVFDTVFVLTPPN